MTEIRTEWAAQMAWPDGHTEVRGCNDRRHAEVVVESLNDNERTDATAVLVSRTITVTGWAPVAFGALVGAGGAA